MQLQRETTKKIRTATIERMEDRRLLSATVVPVVNTGTAGIVQLTNLPLDSRYYSPIDPTAFNGSLYYLAPDTSTDSPTTLLWRSDGTSAGTVKVADGAVTGGTSLAAGASAIYAVSGTTLYKTDGTTVTSVALPATDTWQVLGVAGGRAYLMEGFDTTYGTTASIWSTDGTTTGTVKLGDYTSPLSPLNGGDQPSGVALGDAFVFKFGSTIYRSDGTAAGTTALATPDASNTVSAVVSSGSNVYFTSNFNGQLWVTDGTTAGTRQLQSGRYYSDLTPGTNGGLFFSDEPSADLSPLNLDVTDGTVAGTVSLSASAGVTIAGNLNTVALQRITVLGGRAFFVGVPSGSATADLYVSDGTAAGTTALANLGSAAATENAEFTNDGSRVEFRVGEDASGDNATHNGIIYVSDGTTAGTAAVSTSVPTGELTATANTLFLTTTDYSSVFHSSLPQHVGPGQLLAFTIPSPPFTTTTPTPTPSATGLAPTVTHSTVPTTAVFGKTVAGTVRTTLINNTGALAAATTPTVVQVYATTTGVIDANSILVGTASKKFKLAAGKSTAIGVKVRATSLPVDNYTLLVRSTDAAGDLQVSPDGPSLVVATPTITLTAVGSAATPKTVSPGRTATALFAITNIGNTVSSGATTIGMTLDSTGATPSLFSVSTVKGPAKVTVKPGQTVRIRVSFVVPADLAAGTYQTQLEFSIAGHGLASLTTGTVVVG